MGITPLFFKRRIFSSLLQMAWLLGCNFTWLQFFIVFCFQSSHAFILLQTSVIFLMLINLRTEQCGRSGQTQYSENFKSDVLLQIFFSAHSFMSVRMSTGIIGPLLVYGACVNPHQQMADQLLKRKPLTNLSQTRGLGRWEGMEQMDTSGSIMSQCYSSLNYVNVIAY